MASRLSASGYALLAAGNLKGSKGCWETNDVESVAALLKEWRSKHAKRIGHAPLYLMGPSSGGFFVTEAARHWRDVRALSIQISVPAIESVRAPLPSGAADFAPLQIVLCSRDTGKLHELDTLRRALPTVDTHVVSPRPVHNYFFSEAMPGLAPELSHAVRDRLVAAGHIDGATSMVRSHPSRGAWRDAVRSTLTAHHDHAGLQQGSLQVTMDGVFARLDLAWAYHASTCALINRTIAFFDDHRGRGARP